MPPDTPTGALRPIELATAAVMGSLTVVLAVVGWLLPHASALQSLGAVPMGVVAYRHRPRAVVAAAISASVVSFLCAGTGPVFSVVTAAIVGGLVGDVKRRNRGLWTLALGALVAGPALALATDGLLAVFSESRTLTLRQLRDVAKGATGLLASIPGLAGPAATIDRHFDDALRDWWLTVGLLVIASFLVGLAAAWVVLGGVLVRTDWMYSDDRLGGVAMGTAGRPGPAGAPARPAPLPVRLVDVTYRYPGMAGSPHRGRGGAPGGGERRRSLVQRDLRRRRRRNALTGVDLRVEGPQMLALVGVNGSGKSTLARVLAGLAPSEGLVQRPGPPGLGIQGGTALVAQRPESQVLGVRVADDVVWGLPPGADVDVEALLRTVGLAGMGQRETTTLSGGELQRVAIAAALARRPSLLISDEATSMIDPEGRRDLMALLRHLPDERRMAVVHVTHRAEEAAVADRVVQLAGGRIVTGDLGRLLGSGGGLPGGRPLHGSGGQAGEGWSPGGGALPIGGALPTGGALPIGGALPEAGPWTGGAPAPGRQPLLEVRGVSHTFGLGSPWAQPALRDIDLAVAEGEGLLVVGGNGSGKSTLAWVLAGLIRPDAGTCLLDGRPMAGQVGAVGLAFQHARLQLQRPTVGADVQAAAGVGPERVGPALAAVGLHPSLASRRLDQLSGGQQRRVALAGLLAREPKVLVLDEPLAGLDPPARRSLVSLLATLRSSGTTLVVISHDVEGMDSVCSRMVRLAGGRLVPAVQPGHDNGPAHDRPARHAQSAAHDGPGDHGGSGLGGPRAAAR